MYEIECLVPTSFHRWRWYVRSSRRGGSRTKFVLKGTMLIFLLSLTVFHIFSSLSTGFPILFFPSSLLSPKKKTIVTRSYLGGFIFFPPFLFFYVASPGACWYYIRQHKSFVTVHRQAPINDTFAR